MRLTRLTWVLDVYGSVLGYTTWYPDTSLLNETNAETGYGSIGTGVDNCVALWSRPPNFILLDYYDSEGNAPFNVAALVNGVSDPTNTVTPGSASSTSTASTSTSTSSSSGGTREQKVGLGLVVMLAVGALIGVSV